MIDIFSLFLTHGLIAIVIVRLLMRKDVDVVGERTSRRDLRQRNAARPGTPDGNQGRSGA